LEQQVTSKEKILKKVRLALNTKSKSLYQSVDFESNIFALFKEETLAESFVKFYTEAGGQFIFCDNQFDCIDKLLDLIELKKWKYIFTWEEEMQNLLNESGISHYAAKDQIEKIQVAISGCEALIARTGSVLVSSYKNSRAMTVIAPEQVFIVKRSQLVPEIKDGLQVLKNKYGRKTPSLYSFITGPVKSTDFLSELPGQMPETIKNGAGPKEMYLFFIDDTKTS
jgi:L-lactate dehydrogenase complex protein LldG